MLELKLYYNSDSVAEPLVNLPKNAFSDVEDKPEPEEPGDATTIFCNRAVLRFRGEGKSGLRRSLTDGAPRLILYSPRHAQAIKHVTMYGGPPPEPSGGLPKHALSDVELG